MKEQDIHKIWAHLDGEGTDSERAQLQQRATDDAAFKVELQKRQILHHTLQQVEAEQPSMRFVMNVMDKLPQLYKKIVVQPLVSPLWIKVFQYALGLLALVYGGVVFQYIQSAESPDAAALPGVEAISRGLAGLSNQIWVMVGILCFSFLFLVVLDRQLKKRFAKKS